MVSNESSSPSTRRMEIAGHQTLEKSHPAQKPSPQGFPVFLQLNRVWVLCDHALISCAPIFEGGRTSLHD